MDWAEFEVGVKTGMAVLGVPGLPGSGTCGYFLRIADMASHSGL